VWLVKLRLYTYDCTRPFLENVAGIEGYQWVCDNTPSLLKLIHLCWKPHLLEEKSVSHAYSHAHLL
jgi:hypothetical protein